MDSIVRAEGILKERETIAAVLDDGSGRYITSLGGKCIVRERNGEIIKWWTGGYADPIDISKDGRYIIFHNNYIMRVLDVVKREFIFGKACTDWLYFAHMKFGPDGLIVTYFNNSLFFVDYLGDRPMKKHETNGAITAFASCSTKLIFATLHRTFSTIYSLDTFAVLFSSKGIIEWIKFADPSVILFELILNVKREIYTLDLITRKIHRREIETYERFINPSSDGKKLLVMTRNAPVTIFTVTPMFPLQGACPLQWKSNRM